MPLEGMGKGESIADGRGAPACRSSAIGQRVVVGPQV
jgi:hypothetical protein